MELLKVHNLDKSKPLVLRHDGLGDVTIPSASEVIVPVSYVLVSFGNPGARNLGANRIREAEYNQLLTKWGMYPGMNEHEWDDLRPKFEVYTLDGERVWTILEDPEGNKGPLPDFTADRVSEASTQSEIARLQTQIDKLMRIAGVEAALESVAPTASPLAEDAPAPEDLPVPGDSIETQAERNEQRDELPIPVKKAVTKDGPASRAK